MTSVYDPRPFAETGDHGPGLKAPGQRASRRIAMLSMHTSPLAQLGGREAGGMNVYVRELSQALGERGYAVDVFTRRQSPDAPEVQPFGPNARVVQVHAGPAQPLPKDDVAQHIDAFAAAVRAFADRASLAYDLVHSHYWMSGAAGIALAEAWDVPHIAMFHTLGELKIRARITEREPPARIAAETRIAAHAHRIVVATEHERAVLTTLYRADPSRIVVVPCGVDTDVFTPVEKGVARRALGLPADKRLLLYVGRIEPLKGIDVLIGAAAALHEDENFLVLIVGGDARAADEMAALRAQAEQLGVDHHISFVGAVDHARLPLYYSAADVCVVPSYYESFGMVAVEAMACGTPVVASRVGGLASTVADGETGYLISWRCPEPFAERLEQLLENDELRASFGAAAREAAERYRWPAVADAIASVYTDTLAARTT